MAHQVCSLLFAAPTRYYPLKLGGTASSSTYNMTTNSADCIFNVADRQARIWSIHVQPGNSSTEPVTYLTEFNVGAARVMELKNENNRAGYTLTFGPEGILVPDGFYLDVTQNSARLTVVYDVVTE